MLMGARGAPRAKRAAQETGTTMNDNLFRIWLPVSAMLHALLIGMCYLMPLPDARADRGPEIRIVHIAELPPEPPAVKVAVTPPRPAQPPQRPRALPPRPPRRPVATPAPVRPAQPVRVVSPEVQPPVVSALPAPGGGAAVRPPELARWGELKTIAQLAPAAATAPARELAPRAGPLRAPPLSGGGGASLAGTPSALPGIIGSVVTSERGTLVLPVGPPGGTHVAAIVPRLPGFGMGGNRSGVPGMGGDNTPAVPNLSTLQTQLPGASAPGGGNAPVFRPGFPGGPIPPNGGSALVPERETPSVPFGLPGGTAGGRGTVVAGPTVKTGTNPGAGTGPGQGPARPAHGPNALTGPTLSYPSLAEKEGNSGVVIIALKISAEGQASSAVIEKRSSADALDNAALRAALKWPFRPGEDGKGHCIPGSARLEFRFELGKAPEVRQL